MQDFFDYYLFDFIGGTSPPPAITALTDDANTFVITDDLGTKYLKAEDD